MELVKLLFLISSFWATVALANSARPYENVDEPIDLFWAARGKKSWPYWQKILNSDGNQKRDETPFWAARGKKYSEHDAPFWAARGKKDGNAQLDMSQAQFWAARGKRVVMEEEQEMEPIREKRSLSSPGTPAPTPFYCIARLDPTAVETFWPARGKKNPATPGN